MYITIEIPEQKTDYWEIEQFTEITAKVISVSKTEDAIYFVLDCRINDPTTECKTFTSLRLYKYIKSKSLGLYAEYKPEEDGCLDYFDIKVSSAKEVTSFPGLI